VKGAPHSLVHAQQRPSMLGTVTGPDSTTTRTRLTKLKVRTCKDFKKALLAFTVIFLGFWAFYINSPQNLATESVWSRTRLIRGASGRMISQSTGLIRRFSERRIPQRTLPIEMTATGTTPASYLPISTMLLAVILLTFLSAALVNRKISRKRCIAESEALGPSTCSATKPN
jgi:hypothetical protein